MTTATVQERDSSPAILPRTERFVSLDVFRGLTIAGMILVNNPGSWSYVYPPLEHAKWNGWTPTDLIFPFFLFIVGVSITLSMGKRVASDTERKGIYLRILRRTLILFALGVFLNGFPYFELSSIRIPGVLQRIALCYFFSAILFLKTSFRTQVVITFALLVGYWLIMTLVPVPGHGAGVLDKEGNLAAYVDNFLLRGHLWQQSLTWDPEGLLSTIPAVATTMLGVLTGQWLRSSRDPRQKTYGLLAGALIGIILGLIMNVFFPINKSLWTSSYVLLTAGLAMLFLALCYRLVDQKGYKKIAMPFVVFGVNAIAIYVLAAIVAVLIDVFHVGAANPNGERASIKDYIYEHLFASWAGPFNGSLLFALFFVLLMFVAAWILYRKRIFIKV
jgi:predicted acyltransferase